MTTAFSNLRIEKPNPQNIKKIVAGLKEIKANPTPFDIRQSELLISYMEANFEGLFDFLKERESTNQPEGWVPDTTFLLLTKIHSSDSIMYVIN